MDFICVCFKYTKKFHYTQNKKGITKMQFLFILLLIISKVDTCLQES